MVADRRMVADVVPAPHDDVVADRDERLNRVVLEDETVVADGGVAPERASGAHVRHQPVPAPLRLVVDTLAQAVHLPVPDRDEHATLSGGKRPPDRLERDDREAGHRGLLDKVTAGGGPADPMPPVP